MCATSTWEGPLQDLSWLQATTDHELRGLELKNKDMHLILSSMVVQVLRLTIYKPNSIISQLKILMAGQPCG